MPRGGRRAISVAPTFGYLDRKRNRFKFCVNNRTRWVAPLVCEAFHGERPVERPECMHLDEDSANNRQDNLAWGTKSANQRAPQLQGARRKRMEVYWANKERAGP